MTIKTMRDVRTLHDDLGRAHYEDASVVEQCRRALTVSLAHADALDAIAGAVCLDAFGEADPAEVFRRVLAFLKEHEAMRHRLVCVYDEAREVGRTLAIVSHGEEQRAKR